jgi:hypothetical protein
VRGEAHGDTARRSCAIELGLHENEEALEGEVVEQHVLEGVLLFVPSRVMRMQGELPPLMDSAVGASRDIGLEPMT